jgi:hypothetical protein
MKSTIMNDFFIPGKISLVTDSSFGSSSKGIVASYIAKNSNNYTFVCNNFMPQASHTVIEPDGKTYIYKQLNSNAHRHEEFEKLYIGQGSVIDLEVLLEEIKMVGIPDEKIGIAPNCVILQKIDTDYEKGIVHFDGSEKENKSLQMKFGSTVSGVGAARARKILRDKNVLLARDVPELSKYICNVSNEIIKRLKNGESGLGEIPQGWALSYGLDQFYPHSTSRNCNVAAFFDDMMVSPAYLGNVMLVQRTFPIRINSKKYISKKESIDQLSFGELPKEFQDEYKKSKDISVIEKFFEERTIYKNRLYSYFLYPEPTKDGQIYIMISSKPDVHLYWDEIERGNIPYDIIDSDSGHVYPDQKEITWEELTQKSGSPNKIFEQTTLTRLPRRVFTYSKQNLIDSIDGNMTNHKIFIAVNFANYVDWEMWKNKEFLTEKFTKWLKENIISTISGYNNVELKMIGVSPLVDDFIILEKE